MIDRLIDAAEIELGKPKPTPVTVMDQLLADAARGNYHVPTLLADHPQQPQ